MFLFFCTDAHVLFLWLSLFYPSSSSSSRLLVLTLSLSIHLFSLTPSLPVLQCDVTIGELMCRILRVLHSSFPTHTAQMKANADAHHVCSQARAAMSQYLSLICPVHLHLTSVWRTLQDTLIYPFIHHLWFYFIYSIPIHKLLIRFLIQNQFSFNYNAVSAGVWRWFWQTSSYNYYINPPVLLH